MEKDLLFSSIDRKDKIKFLEEINDMCRDTLMETLDIKFIDFGDDYLIAEMPVNKKVHQPMKILHGGASGALLESVGSGLLSLVVNLEEKEVKGLEFSINHIKSVSSGKVIATARTIHKGKTTHFSEITIRDEKNNLISQGKMTNIILDKKK